MTSPHSREQLRADVLHHVQGWNIGYPNHSNKIDDEVTDQLMSLIDTYTAQQSLLRAKEELEKIHALDTGDSSGALAVANAVADCLSELDKEIKASRLDAEGGK
jgi:hypothetical protein